MSIATKHGDGGQTGLAGGIRISKADLRVESYGTVDELNAFLGFARSLCKNPQIATWTEEIQRSLFRVGAVLATPSDSPKQTTVVSPEDIDKLTALVHQIEAGEGILSDWSLPGAHTESAAYEMARTVCRRAERATVRLIESGVDIAPTIVPYLNRLSDLLWLFGRRIEIEAGIDAHLREDRTAGLKWGAPKSAGLLSLLKNLLDKESSPERRAKALPPRSLSSREAQSKDPPIARSADAVQPFQPIS